MTLDEPKDDDQYYEVDGLPFILGSSVVRAAQGQGPVVIDCLDSYSGKVITVSFAGGSAC